MVNKLAELIASGKVNLNELANSNALIEDAKFVKEALEACKNKFLFRMGENKIRCYSYENFSGEYSCWGDLTFNGTLTLCSNWGGNHVIGTVNLNNANEVLLELNKKYNSGDTMPVQLRNFLKKQLE